MKADIEKLVYGGDGLSRVEGEVILTPFVLPGESVEIERDPKRSGIARARLLEVLHASADRIAPGCPYFMTCGGCHYQHAEYEAQIAAKRSILIETMGRTGKIEVLPEIEVITGEPWSYRNRIQLYFQDGKVGYRQSRSHNLIAIDQCPISSPLLNTCIAALNRMVGDRRFPGFMQVAELFTNETGVQFNVIETQQPLAQRFFDWLAEEIPELVTGALEYEGYRVSYGSFFQVNRFLVRQLMDVVIGDAKGDTALDLYAGVGLFTIPLAQRFARVVAVESGTGAVRDMGINAERAGVKVETWAESVDTHLARAEEKPDFILADPPRTGLGKQVVRHFLELEPREIVVVACDPATFARDAQLLIAGGYQLDKLSMVDLFPQTYHVETVARFVR